MKYPSAIAGAISASAPLLGFPGERPTWDSSSYYHIVTRTAEHYSTNCSANLRAAFPLLDKLGATGEGRAQLKDAFRLCQIPSTSAKASMLKYMIRDAFDTLTMGNYPFASNYIAGTASLPVPAWPAEVACSKLNDSRLRTSAIRLLPAVREAISVLYNVSQTANCFDLPDFPTATDPMDTPNDGIWDWQWCTQQLPDSFWFGTSGRKDMFWPNPFNQSLVDAHCEMTWGVKPRQKWIVQEYGGRQLGEGHSNIVFTSGGFDPQCSMGIANNLSDSLTALLIPQGGHHLDLMFSHAADPPEVRAVRQHQLSEIRRWILEFAKKPVAKSWGDGL